MTDDATLMVAEFFDKAIDADLVNTAYGAYSPPWCAAAADGQIAGVTSASWGDALIQSISGGEGKWKVAPMQTWGGTGTGSTYLGGSTSAVLANSPHPKEALDFCLWLTTQPEAIERLIENSGIGWSPSPDYIGKAQIKIHERPDPRRNAETRAEAGGIDVLPEHANWPGARSWEVVFSAP